MLRKFARPHGRVTSFTSLLAQCSLLFAFAASAYAAVENLDEVTARKARMPTAPYSNTLLENAASYYRWQPETLSYTDVLSNNEVWQLTNSPVYFNSTQDISTTHWSANGKRVMFQSKRPTAAFNTYGDTLWMLSNTDGAYLRPAKGAAAQCAEMDPYPLWSPILADVLYSGRSSDGAATLPNGFYRTNVTDTTSSFTLLLSVAGSTRLSLKKGISGDGRKVMIVDTTNGKFQPATVYPEANKAFDTAAGYSQQLAFDYYWGQAPTSWAFYHDNFLAGAVNGADGVWNYIMPENTSGSWWRARLTGSGTNQAPVITADHTSPYSWGGELEPINSPVSTTNPWCPQGVVSGTDCMEYFSHFTPDRWARYGISTKSGSSPYGTSIADLRNHGYKVKGFTPATVSGVAAPWVQHHDWEAWSDWSASSAYTVTTDYQVGAIVTQNVNNPQSQKMLASPHTRYNSNGASNGGYTQLARPTQSPDGTKVMFNSSFTNASDLYPQIFWTVAYYPYPPEIKGAAKSSANVRLTWDFNQGTASAPNFLNPRTYATRGWPHETNDRPPAPREIDRFRVWVSPNGTTWTPLGTTVYNNCRGANECGLWTETSWSFDAAQPVGSTRYYGVTSLEFSGLESRTLSNVWSVTLDAQGNITQQAQYTGYPADPGGKSDFYTASPPSVVAQYSYMTAPASSPGQYTIKWKVPADASMIRYYNIYAKDGAAPLTNSTSLADRQRTRIASVPASSDYAGTGSFTYIDWLGATDGSTKYVVTTVDYQGNETVTVGVPAPPVIKLLNTAP